MKINPVDISICETTSRSDFFKYVRIVIGDLKFTWLIWICLMRIFGNKKCCWFVIKYKENIIGGFAIVGYPVAKYKPINWFKYEFKNKIDELMAKGYQGLSWFVIDPEYQNQGIGSMVWDSFFKKQPLKLFFTATRKAVPFYLRHGCRAFYPDRYTIYTYENTVIR
jgi:GNAT superfamily N-acetyltransferase